MQGQQKEGWIWQTQHNKTTRPIRSIHSFLQGLRVAFQRKTKSIHSHGRYQKLVDNAIR